MLEREFLLLDRPIFGARSSCFGARDLVLESTVLVSKYDPEPNGVKTYTI